MFNAVDELIRKETALNNELAFQEKKRLRQLEKERLERDGSDSD